MTPLVLFHKNCLDGFSASFAVWKAFGNEAYYRPIQYGDIKSIDDVHKLGDLKRNIYIIDFSFSKEIMDYIISESITTTWLDHHKTGFEMWCGMEYNIATAFMCSSSKLDIILDNNRSGALIAWEYFHPGTKIPVFIKHVDDGDRWQFKMEHTKAFTKAIWSYAPWTFDMFNEMFFNDNVEEQNYMELILEGNAILKAHDANVQSVLRGATRPCKIRVRDDVLSGLAANCPPHLQSDVGHALAKQSNTFGLLWYINKDNLCLCSLRSIGDYDVSALAKYFGGGGHRAAAGFTIEVLELLKWLS